MLLALTAAIAVQATAFELKVVPVPGKGYLITAPKFPETQLDEISRRLEALAVRQCGKLKVRYGRFNYGTAIVDAQVFIADYQQRFSCFDPANDPYFPAPANWQAQAGDNTDVLAFASRYMAVIDAVDARAGIAMMEPILDLTEAEWLVLPNAVAKIRGTGSRSYGRPEWQNNPAGAPHPGAYATVYFSGNYSGLAAHCGVLFLYRRGPNDYQVTQQTIRAIAKADVAAGRMTAADVKAACPS